MATLQPYDGLPPLVADERDTVLGDFLQYKGVNTTVLKLKTSYARTDPVSMSALASADEGKAREAGKLLKEK